MRGETNAAWLSSSRFLSFEQTTPDFTLVNLGNYPGLLANGTTCVVGELYEVPDDLVSALDEFEDHPTVYIRSSLTLKSGEHAFTYLLRPEHAPERSMLTDGDWKRRSSQK